MKVYIQNFSNLMTSHCKGVDRGSGGFRFTSLLCTSIAICYSMYTFNVLPPLHENIFDQC